MPKNKRGRPRIYNCIKENYTISLSGDEKALILEYFSHVQAWVEDGLRQLKKLKEANSPKKAKK